MVVTAQNDRGRDLSLIDCLVESGSYLGASLAVCIQDTGLGTYHKVVPPSLLYPSDIVHHLAAYLLRSIRHYLSENSCCNLVRLCKIFRILRHAYPSERTEPVVKEQRSHDVLYI